MPKSQGFLLTDAEKSFGFTERSKFQPDICNQPSMASARTRRWYVYGPDRGPLGGTMERVAADFASMAGVLFEWDGSFSWAMADQGWHFHGNLYDDSTALHYVDLHARWQLSSSPVDVRDAFENLLLLFRPPPAPPVANRSMPSVTLLRLPEQTWELPREVDFVN